MTANQGLSESLEDYLEAILEIVQEKRTARATDIAARLNVSNASVTGALHSLVGKGLVRHAPYDDVTLTPEGEAVAAGVIRRHHALKEFFVKILEVNEAEAEQCACRMEHAMPDNVLDRFLQFLARREPAGQP